MSGWRGGRRVCDVTKPIKDATAKITRCQWQLQVDKGAGAAAGGGGEGGEAAAGAAGAAGEAVGHRQMQEQKEQ